MVYFMTGGRLGNLMLEYAAAQFCAKQLKTGVGAILHEKHCLAILRRYPMLFHDIQVVEDIPDGASVWKEQGFEYSKIALPPPSKDLVIGGTFLSEKYFSDDIGKRYLPTGPWEEDIKARFGAWLDRPNVTSIHIRRGDYIKQQYLFNFVGKNYYRKCINRLKEVKDFIVCTDDVAWCRKFLLKEFPDRNFLIDDGRTVLDDLWLQALCKHNIIANSTFSWWGAVMNQNPTKRVLAPSMWFGFELKHLETRDICSPSWEIVPNTYDFGDYVLARLEWAFVYSKAFVGRILRRLHIIK